MGTWQTVETMNGLQVTITVHARPDGSMTQLFAGPGGTEQQDCSWRFSDGVLFVRYGDGASGKGSIDWIDNNQFVLTIIDNGVPAYTGVKRRYRRL
ncbi:MAG: hypothetical protein ACREA2_01375 [Blastocatellia bacterium]